MTLDLKDNKIVLNDGNRMPAIGLGTWKSEKGRVGKAVTAALEMGYRHIDCAPIYGNEAEVGNALKAAFDKGLDRKEVFVTSKLWNTKHRKDDVMPACKKTLADLQLDYLDLYLIHWPMAYKSGDDDWPEDANGNPLYEDVPITQTWQAMEELVYAGLVKSIGLANFNSEQIVKVAASRIMPAVLQIESHPYLIQPDLIPFAKLKGIAVTTYSPLGSADREWAKPTDPVVLEEPKLKEIALRMKRTPAQVALNFQLQRGCAVIPKTVHEERLKENFAATTFAISEQDVGDIVAVGKQYNFRTCIPPRKVKGQDVPRDALHVEWPFRIPF